MAHFPWFQIQNQSHHWKISESHEIISTPKVYFKCIFPQIMLFSAQQGEANEGLELDEMDKGRNGLSPYGTSSFFWG